MFYETLEPPTLGSASFLVFYDYWMRIRIEVPGLIKDSFPHLVRFTRPISGMNEVLYSHLDESELDRVIQTQIDYFAPLGQPFEWMVYEHDGPAGLDEHLRAKGFADDSDPEAVTVLEIENAPTALLQSTDIDIRQITQRDGLDDVIQVERQVLGADFSWLKSRLGDHLDLPGYLNVYVAYIEDRPVSTAWIYFHPGVPFAGLFGGSTIEEYRRRGIYTALVGVRLREAQRRGYRYLTTGASPFSRPILEKNGFIQITRAFSMKWRGENPDLS